MTDERNFRSSYYEKVKNFLIISIIKSIINHKSTRMQKKNERSKKKRKVDGQQVGFRSVEEKKSLEILLKERPFDKAKLKQFCLRFTVPAIHRNFLWKILLGVTPVYAESQQFVSVQRRTEFNDLRNALRVAKIMEEDWKPHQVYLTMWLLRTRRAKIDMTTQLETPLFRSATNLLLCKNDGVEVRIVGRQRNSIFLEQISRFL